MKEIDVNYSELFKHTEKLRKVLLIATGRTGSDFFQSLLDSHSEILQFTGIWFFHHWWGEAKCKENLLDLINEFIWHSCILCNHIARFKSYYNKEERWGQLGNNKNDFFEVNVDSFKNHMLNILLDKELNSRNFFLAVNLAYGLATKVDIKKTKILFYHIHLKEKLKDFRDDFTDFDVISTIREPRNTLSSGIEHWKKYDAKMYNPSFLYLLVKRIFEESEPILQYTRNSKTLKLEDLHLFSKEVLKEFCRIYNLQLEDSMFESSYHGKKWWGDEISGKYLDGFNKNINKKKWENKLFFHDNFLIEFILEDRLKHYGYFLRNKMSKMCFIFAIFLVFLPMKYELKILFYSLKNSRSIKGKPASLLRRTLYYVGCSLFFYILRVLLCLKFMWKKISKKTFLADFFNQKYYRKVN